MQYPDFEECKYFLFCNREYLSNTTVASPFRENLGSTSLCLTGSSWKARKFQMILKVSIKHGMNEQKRFWQEIEDL